MNVVQSRCSSNLAYHVTSITPDEAHSRLACIRNRIHNGCGVPHMRGYELRGDGLGSMLAGSDVSSYNYAAETVVLKFFVEVVY